MVCCFALFVFVLCLVYSMLSVSLDCPFFIASPVFSNFYVHTRLRHGSSRLNVDLFRVSLANDPDCTFSFYSRVLSF